ncbi:hypothetical protein MIH18_23605 (plasmid) [Marinobacter sp. M3C]|jgi:hypothetical protein|uniref:hypothetical protein n=1 Tax=Marinobacter sp. M3C TaxID=2917715 RepID=UPI0020101377|nr:hypothetical protein [Marinobacter sp. M3C]MCL1485156.1 hypothetical protein [Marinobacter sp.]UQG62819.1 hypothetical protein MIH18_23605 [Marinobacter sp. M3C]
MKNSTKSESAKYPALRIIAAWYKALGLVVGGILIIVGAVSGWQDESFVAFISWGSAGVIFIILAVSIAEIIQVFLDTERSTRDSAGYLQRLVELQAKPQPSAPARATPAVRVRRPPEPQPATPSQADSIKVLIRGLHEDGLTEEQIVKELQSENISTLDGANGWTSSAVRKVLSKE